MAKRGEFTLEEEVKIKSGVLNTIIAMYQVAVSKVLGSGSAAMTQIILREATRLADEMFSKLGYELPEVEALEEEITDVFKMFGFSHKVEVETPEAGKHAEVGSEYVIKVYDSIFKPVAYMLMQKGIKYTLSPESFLAAYIIQKALEKKGVKARVRINVEPLKSLEEPLVIRVTIR